MEWSPEHGLASTHTVSQGVRPEESLQRGAGEGESRVVAGSEVEEAEIVRLATCGIEEGAAKIVGVPGVGLGWESVAAGPASAARYCTRLQVLWLWPTAAWAEASCLRGLRYWRSR